MRGHHGPVERFVRQVHRRLTLVRLAERVGLCAAVACAAGLVLELVLIWRGQGAWEICLAALAGGCLTGLIWGGVVRPTRLEAAMEADRQLHFQDLLGTAYLLKNPQTNPWEQTVMALAEAKCRQTLPSAVVLKRWGGRAWGGVALGSLLVVALAFIPPPVAQSASNESPASFSRKNSIENDLYKNGRLLADNSAAKWTAIPARPEDNRTFGQGITGQNPDGGQPTYPSADTTADHTALSATPGGSGTGSSQNPNAIMKSTPTGPMTSTGHRDGSIGVPAAGTGLTAENAIPSDQAAGFSASSAIGGHRIAPWQTSSWPQQQADALQAVRQGKVPDSYRDLVRAYFERE